MPPRRLATVTLCCLALVGCRDDAIPTARPAATGDVTALHEAGTVIAANTVAMDSPGWGGSQRITWLVAEGTRVVPGDTLVRFDSTEFDEYMQQYRDDRDVAVMAVASARAQGSANATRARNAIAKARLAWERAQLELENQRFESRTVRESSELAGRQAEIDLKQSLRDSTAQATLDSLEIAQAELRAAKEQARVNRLQTYLDELTLTARESGMVVYHREYTEEGIKVLRAGDEVSRQAPVLEVTDTSAMRVRFTVHESDRWRLAPGQPVRIVLDAYATTEYPGEILSVGRLPLSAEEGSVARRFEAVAAIDGQDPRLKPGMSARVIIPLGGTP